MVTLFVQSDYIERFALIGIGKQLTIRSMSRHRSLLPADVRKGTNKLLSWVN